MTPDDQPTIVSLESHRRRKLADARKRPAKPRTAHERAINWRRVPLFLALLAAFMVGSWLLRQAGGLLNPFH